jgi:GGDEF domain-containing protein
MKAIRLPTAVLLTWILLFYGLEQLSRPVQFGVAIHLLVPATAVAIVLATRLAPVPVFIVTGGLVGLLLVIKWATGDPIAGAALPTTGLEASAVVVTALLARRLSVGVAAFEQAVINLTIGYPGERRARQAEVYREIQRARVHQRPLAVLAVRQEAGYVDVALDRLVQETQQELRQHYLLAGLSRAMRAALADYNIVAKRGDYFLVILPETTAESLPEIAQCLRRSSQEQLGVPLRIGAAFLPSDATTFEGLVDKAVAEMKADNPAGSDRNQPVATLGLESLPVLETTNGPLDHQRTESPS